MRDHDPMILRRMLALRQFPLLAAVELSELATVAENVTEATLETGVKVATLGEPIASIHLVIDGAIEVASVASWTPRDAFGALEVLAGRPARAHAFTSMPTRTLEIRSADLTDLLEDNFGVLQSILRHLASRTPITQEPRLGPPVARDARIGLVDRLVLLRRHAAFQAARLQALATVAHAAHEVTFPAGAVVARAGEAPSSALFVVDGSLHSAHSTVGLSELLGETHHATTIEAVSEVRALAITSAALLDVLEDHPDLGLGMAAAYARATLDRGVPN